VVSANQALYWQALRAAGYREPVPGYGRLLRMNQEWIGLQ
jgi:maleate cis-trans isomerase